MVGHTMLYKRSSFFVDAFNIICHIDLFLYHEIRHQILAEPDGLLADIFSEKFPLDIWKEEPDDIKIIHLASRKQHQNILFDWASTEKLSNWGYEILVDGEPANLSAEDTAEIFLTNLYAQCLTEPTCEQLIQITEFGNALKLLMKDSQLEKMVFHIPFESQIVIETLLREFSGPNNKKLFITVGDIDLEKDETGFLKANSYVFENVTDVDKYLRRTRRNGIEVLIPTFEYNMMEDRGTLEKTMEQVMISRMRLEEPLPDYLEKYNISVNSISVPV